MASKTNCIKNGKEYYRTTATIGRDSKGNLIRKEFYGKNKKEAEEKKTEYLNSIQNGLTANFDKISLGCLMHTWLFEVQKIKVKPTSFERYEGIFRNYIQVAPFYGKKIKDIKQLELQRYYNHLFKSGKSSNSIKFLNKLLKNFFNYSIDEGYLIKNLCNNNLIIPGKDTKVKKEIEVFNNEEIKKLIDTSNGHRLKLLILLALGTGLRQGELLALTWNDIDFIKKEINVEKTIKKVKTFDDEGKSVGKKILIQSPKSVTSNRLVPIPSNLIELLKNHRIIQNIEKENADIIYTDNNLVFATCTGNFISTKNLFNSYSALLVKAKIKHKKFHALRHTYASQLFKVGVPLKTVQTLLGHSDISITANIYTHVMPSQKTNAVEKLNSLFT
ncbi:tyrosine-type recombinase/integrase [Clostridium felsineum]|uniref:Tyrosine recombinase XerC n=1 Tax=Clostridium felsineum TaxID=36839 RepID=A0A1S8LD37_9CLOT|nr:site-specific integrase [Clostridium felsineum]URZ05867.1 Tyrosine recombinase XerC [Clostridium felsineum]URZ10904.1 Tyrosine recombinase XerC [Clostridium felsineum]